MSGTLGLSTPWAREAIDRAGRDALEAEIPEGVTLGVSMTANRGRWLLWLVRDGAVITPKVEVSAGLPLIDACRWALRVHWKAAA